MVVFSYGPPVHDPKKKKPVEPKPVFQPVCLTCGYDMRGAASNRCPECGQVFSRSEWEREVKQAKDAIAEVEELLNWVRYAWMLVVAGLAAMLITLIPGVGSGVDFLLRVFGFLFGAVGFLLAMNVLRVRRIPMWARGHLRVQPDFGSALVGLIGGPAIAAGAIVLP